MVLCITFHVKTTKVSQVLKHLDENVPHSHCNISIFGPLSGPTAINALSRCISLVAKMLKLQGENVKGW